MSILLEDIINDYYDLQGDDPPSVPEEQDLRLINRTMDELTRRYNFGFSRVTQNLSLVSLQASLPSFFSNIYDVRYRYSSSEDDIIYRRVDEASKDQTSKPAFWITGNTQTGWKLNTNIDTYNPLEITFYRRQPTVSAFADGVFFPYSEPIALGAYLRKRKIDNPDADIGQEKAEYEQAVGMLISYDQRLNGRKGRYIGVHEAEDLRTGT